MRRLLFLFLLLPAMVLSQNLVSIDVHDVPSSKGKISVAIYNTKEGFLKFDKVFKCDSIVAQKGITHIAIKDIPEGEYALAIFHDVNGNNKLDTNWLGIPKEKVAFSNAKMRTFGPPSFKDCAFNVEKDTRISVSL
ncbi:DUF2141 domain-containing protein [uncultured Croceitalea sp.]|uniref:DUF2141 domain-containing protein n=1 Tax=uncultured Croceitalea sp. TaxID=1798908 RepID=UPI0033065702